MNIPKKALELINIIESHGFEAYIVGGYVRDSFIDKHSFDIDISSNAHPEELKKILSTYKIIDTGIKHGTITVLTGNLPIEITTYRIDGVYNDKRHPDKVDFVSTLKEDIGRRDFTINALAYNPKSGLIDYYGGMLDLENKIIKTVGIADKRFREDGLRILRALRFASELGFSLESKTQKSIFKNKLILNQISSERKLSEFKKLIVGKNVKEVILNYSEILDLLIPGLHLMQNIPQNSPYHIYNLLEHTALSVENIKPLFHLRIAMLLHDIGKLDTHTTDENGIDHFYSHTKFSYQKAEKIVNTLKLDKNTGTRIVKLVKYHDLPIENSSTWVKKWLNRLGEEDFFDLMEVKKADCLSQALSTFERIKDIEKIENLGLSIIQNQECFSLKQLAINGKDLIDIGFKPDPTIGLILKETLDMVITKELSNDKALLIAYAKKRLNNLS